MHDFSLNLDKRTATFQFELDFTEGVDRLCWTPTGIEKLIKLGLWKRQFDRRGNLITKPMAVETLMRVAARG
jgi:hypothetical protein